MILVVCAVAKELEFLAPRAGVEILVTGVGPVEAAANVSRALAQGRYELVVNAGIAGVFEGCANVGDGVVVVDERVELDLENGEQISLPGGLTVADRASSSLDLSDRLVELGFPALRGITVTRVTATESTARRLSAGGAQVESMEGFAVLRAADIAGVPAIELRGISNRAGDRSCSEWDFSAGVTGLQRILDALLALVAPPEDRV